MPYSIRLPAGGPRLLFKAARRYRSYGLISRFSEDIDITVFRSIFGEEADFEQLEALTKNKRTKRLNAIKTACQVYIDGKLRVELDALGKRDDEAAGKDPALLSVVLDDADEDRQSLLIHYPSAVEKSEYVTPSVKIESGAKSALDRNTEMIVLFSFGSRADFAPDSIFTDGVTYSDSQTALG